MSRGFQGSEYLEWVKTRKVSRFNLATSGLVNYPIAELDVNLEDLEINGPSLYGYEPLQEALAAKCGVPPDRVVAASGTTMANYIALAALLLPGDEVLVEHPTYEPLLAAARHLGAEVKRFPRRFETAFQVDSDEVERLVTSRTKVIVITNLHNPTCALTADQTLRRLGGIARKIGAHVLVDEVYLECCYEKIYSAVNHGDEFVATGSLTKAYGLAGLRCGWVLAEADLARRMWRIKDLFDTHPPHSAELMSVIALRRLDRIIAGAKTHLKTNRQLFDGFLRVCPHLEAAEMQFGTTVFPRLKHGNMDDFIVLLRDKYETDVVPGHFFETPNHFRLGLGGDNQTLAKGLERLGAALDETA